MPEGDTLPYRSAGELIYTGASAEQVIQWVQHHLRGTWFTSDLIRLMLKADRRNFSRLSLGYPDEAVLVRAYREGRDASWRGIYDERGANEARETAEVESWTDLDNEREG